LLAVCLAAALAGCNRGQGGYQGFGAGEIVPVTVATVERKTMPSQLHAIGSVQPFSTVSIKARIGGALTAVHFREGQDVRKGDLLFTIDPRPLRAALTEAQANKARDIARLKQAEEEERRWSYMVQHGVGSQERYGQAQADAAALRAAVAADEAAIQTATLNVEYSEIRSPIDGRTGGLILHEGNLVKANDDNAMVVINQVRPVYVDFSVPEKDLAEIRRRTAAGTLDVHAIIPGQEDHEVTGALNFIDNTVDRTTGTIRLRAVFDNQDQRLWPGQFVNVNLTLTQHPNSLVVPSQAIQTGQDGQYVFVVRKDKTAERLRVVVGESVDGQTVISKGLRGGETVITDGQLRLLPGSKVEIKKGIEDTQGSVS
jgi:multidrug efflux system membrane fusion protein